MRVLQVPGLTVCKGQAGLGINCVCGEGRGQANQGIWLCVYEGQAGQGICVCVLCACVRVCVCVTGRPGVCVCVCIRDRQAGGLAVYVCNRQAWD